MKKLLVAAMAAGVIISCSIISSNAAVSNNEKGYISLSTSANAEVLPDVAEISFAVKTSDVKSMQKATVQNKEISDKLQSALKGMLDTSKGDFIKTSDYNASPVYTYNGNKKNFDRYEVSNRIIVHTKSINKIGEMIDKAISVGATNVDSLNFSVSNYESKCNSLIEIASNKANTRASIAAKSMGAVLDGIRSVDISCSENKSHSRVYMAKNMLSAVAEGASDSTSTAISEGVVKIYANVNASFYVK